MDIQEKVKQYLSEGKTQAEALNLAYNSHNKEVPKMQIGGTTDMYGSEITAPIQRKNIPRSFYDNRRGIINVGEDYKNLSPQEQKELIAHENRHDWQYKNDRSNFNITHNPDYAFNEKLQKKPGITTTDEVYNNYHNRQQKETDGFLNNIKENYPQFSFIPNKLMYDKGFTDSMYDNKFSLEGEAQYYQKTGEKSFQIGGTWEKQLERVRRENANKPKPTLTVAELIAEKKLKDQNIGREEPPQIQRDNTRAVTKNKPELVSKVARNKTDKEIVDERKDIRQKADNNVLNKFSTELLNPDNYTRQNLAEAASGLESKFRVSDEPNFYDDHLNFANIIGGMASNLGQAPLQAQQSDSVLPYFTSIGAPLAVGAMAGLGANSTGQFINNIANPLAGTGDLLKSGVNYLENKGVKLVVAPELREGLRVNGIRTSNQLPPIPSELHIPMEGNTINLRRNFNNILLPGLKRKRPTMFDELLDTKFIPGTKKRILPENLNPVVTELGDRVQIKLVGEDNLSRASLTLREKRNWNLGDDGKIIMDELGNPTQNAKEWMSPEMISVNAELQGNRTQDLLYQLGIEEAKKRELRGIYSGETLLSPDKTKKAYERFDKELFKERSAPPSYNREGTELINYNEVGLLGHKNPQLQKEWIENYNKLNKFKREQLSINDLKDKVDMSKKDLLVLGSGIAGLTTISGGLMYENNYRQEQQKIIDNLKQKVAKTPKKQNGGSIYTQDELNFLNSLSNK